MLKRGANVDDRDGLNDMTLLHYACKAGSPGIGDEVASLRAVHLLLTNGADPTLRCRWTDMGAIHYAVYFEVAAVVDYLLTATDRAVVDDICRDFGNGAPLHIAASNMCLDSLKVLLSHGANVGILNELGKTPFESVPDFRTLQDQQTKSGAEMIIGEMQLMLEEAMSSSIPGENTYRYQATGRVVLQALGLSIGDSIFVNGCKSGFLRFCGATQFAPGIWAGVELDEPEGKNDGSVQGISYFRYVFVVTITTSLLLIKRLIFRCQPNHGVFAPMNRISKFSNQFRLFKSPSAVAKVVNYPGVKVSHVSPKVETGMLEHPFFS